VGVSQSAFHAGVEEVDELEAEDEDQLQTFDGDLDPDRQVLKLLEHPREE